MTSSTDLLLGTPSIRARSLSAARILVSSLSSALTFVSCLRHVAFTSGGPNNSSIRPIFSRISLISRLISSSRESFCVGLVAAISRNADCTPDREVGLPSSSAAVCAFSAAWIPVSSASSSWTFVLYNFHVCFSAEVPNIESTRLIRSRMSTSLCLISISRESFCVGLVAAIPRNADCTPDREVGLPSSSAAVCAFSAAWIPVSSASSSWTFVLYNFHVCFSAEVPNIESTRLIRSRMSTSLCLISISRESFCVGLVAAIPRNADCTPDREVGLPSSSSAVCVSSAARIPASSASSALTFVLCVRHVAFSAGVPNIESLRLIFSRIALISRPICPSLTRMD